MSAVLQGEIALVTGASRGIGAAIAQTLAANGARVIGTATSESGAQAISERLSPTGGAGRVLDVRDGAAVETLIDAIGKEFGPLSILVNNAGITRDQLLMDLNILIRTLSLCQGSVRLRAGAGIVADSIAAAELDETRAKARGMLRALGVHA